MSNKCTLSNEELLQRCEEWVHRLAQSSGRDWYLQVPANFNHDPDMMFMELINRFKTLRSSENTSANNKYPIGGYAPGNYQCKCCSCSTTFIGDKRAVQCEPCATKDKEEFDALSPQEQQELLQRNAELAKKMFISSPHRSESNGVPAMRPEDHEQVQLGIEDGLPEYEANFQSGYSAGHDAGYERGKSESAAGSEKEEAIDPIKFHQWMIERGWTFHRDEKIWYRSDDRHQWPPDEVVETTSQLYDIYKQSNNGAL